MVQNIAIVNDGNVVEPASPLQQELSNGFYNGHAKSFVLNRSLHQDPLQVESAKGNHLHLSDGQSVFDATGGAAVACLGHGNER